MFHISRIKISPLFKRLVHSKCTVLAIETSCDDTCVAVLHQEKLNNKFRTVLLSEKVISSSQQHALTGGITPSVAAASHRNNLPLALKQALNEACDKGSKVFGRSMDPFQLLKELDLIAVTQGPGLGPCLGVGILGAKMMAATIQKPLIGIHHMEAHALTSRMELSESLSVEFKHLPVSLPFLCLLVSGGHTQLVVVRDINDYEILATALDDSIGEAFDKVSRKLSLEWKIEAGSSRLSGGAALEEVARSVEDPMKMPQDAILPIPMSTGHQKKKLQFSFSGIKTSVDALIASKKAHNASAHGSEGLRREDVAHIAYAFQYSAIEHLCQKIALAWSHLSETSAPIQQLVISGGVGSNEYLRERMKKLCEQLGMKVHYPQKKYCVDNGVMIAWAALERWHHLQPTTSQPLDKLDMVPKWPLVGYPCYLYS